MSDSLHVKSLLLKALELRPDASMAGLQTLCGVAGFHDMTSGQLNQQPRFADLAETIEQGGVIRIRYDTHEARGVIQQRVLPLNLCRTNEVDYLIAQCMADGRVHQFKLANLIDYNFAFQDALRHST
jgi:predicted DNA-binding transcriptional regulator YafY